MLATPTKSTTGRRILRFVLDLAGAGLMGTVVYFGWHIDVAPSDNEEQARIVELNKPALAMTDRVDATVTRILEHDELSAEDAKDIHALETAIGQLPNVDDEHDESADLIHVSDLYSVTGGVTDFASATFANSYEREVEKRNILGELDTYKIDETRRLKEVITDRQTDNDVTAFFLRGGVVLLSAIGWFVLRRPREILESYA